MSVSLPAGAIGPGLLSAQDAIRLPKPLEHQVAVTLKLIHVYVTDKQGELILDLTQDDFARKPISMSGAGLPSVWERP